jgi:hypothetical protein
LVVGTNGMTANGPVYFSAGMTGDNLLLTKGLTASFIYATNIYGNIGGGGTPSFNSLIVGSGGMTANGPVYFSAGMTGDNLLITKGLTASFIYSTNLTNSGVVQSGSFNTTSDRRAKTNIEPLIAGINFVDDMNPVKFTFKDSQKDSVGFIAQELLELQEKSGLTVPSLVSTVDPYNFTVSYMSIIPVLVKAIQELREEVKSLKNSYK